jgi:hypothetical protein
MDESLAICDTAGEAGWDASVRGVFRADDDKGDSSSSAPHDKEP